MEIDNLTTTVVVPCFNEEARLDVEGFRIFLETPGLHLLFVDDGSTDGTRRILDGMVTDLNGRARVLPLPFNHGKAEAVRAGMRAALDTGSDVVGYYDADLATPPDEMRRLLETLVHTHAQAALAARVAFLGTHISRSALRHYLGRVFATFASMILELPVYDTQCGAKAFRRSGALDAALAQPFVARWAFDVELLGRLLAGTADTAGLPPDLLIEMPLRNWTDKPGSKLRPLQWPSLGTDLLKIWASLFRWRRQSRRPLELPAADVASAP
jgi:dolichyl-phosphate beta-glucosyltransferase